MDKYRFDDQYESVYEYNETVQSYVFCGKYLVFGIKTDMPETEMIDKVEAYDESHF